MSKVDGDLGYARDRPPYIPNDTYRGVFVRAEKGPFEGRERLYLWFKIVTPGPYAGVQLCYSCPCPPEGQSFGLSSKLVKLYVVAMGHPPRRNDRISTKTFKSKIFTFITRPVMRNSSWENLDEADRYSVIAEFLIAEDDTSNSAATP